LADGGLDGPFRARIGNTRTYLTLRAVAAGEELIAVGDGGLLLASIDGGTTQASPTDAEPVRDHLRQPWLRCRGGRGDDRGLDDGTSWTTVGVTD